MSEPEKTEIADRRREQAVRIDPNGIGALEERRLGSSQTATAHRHTSQTDLVCMFHVMSSWQYH